MREGNGTLPSRSAWAILPPIFGVIPGDQREEGMDRGTTLTDSLTENFRTSRAARLNSITFGLPTRSYFLRAALIQYSTGALGNRYHFLTRYQVYVPSSLSPCTVPFQTIRPALGLNVLASKTIVSPLAVIL